MKPERDTSMNSFRRTVLTCGGVTLIELLISLVIAGLVLVPTALIVYEALRGALLPEKLTRADFLLRTRLERVSNTRFSALEDISSTPFDAPYDNYLYSQDCEYVKSDDLSTVSAQPTDYKRVYIRVSDNSGLLRETATLITDYHGE